MAIESEGFRASPDEIIGFHLVADLFGRVRVKVREVFLVDPVPKYLTVDRFVRYLAEEVTVGTLEAIDLAL
jgi:hypothetical protein